MKYTPTSNCLDYEIEFERGIQLFEKNKLTDAYDTFEKLTKTSPNWPEAWMAMSAIAYRVGDAHVGNKIKEHAYKLSPRLAPYACIKDELLKQQNNFSESTSMLESAITYHNVTRSDAIIVSYPKCGRTWLRFMLGISFSKLFGIKTTYEDALRLVHMHRKCKTMPRIFITHDEYPQFIREEKIGASKNIYRGKKIIFLIRDPRDVVVSNYFQYTRRGDWRIANSPFNGAISDFIRRSIGGVRGIVKFYNIWSINHHVTDMFMVVKYESLIQNTQSTLKKIIDFITGNDTPMEPIELATSIATFDNMKRIEKSGLTNSFILRQMISSDPESMKVRKGKVGGYKEYLSPSDIQYINAELTRLHEVSFYSDYKTPNG